MFRAKRVLAYARVSSKEQAVGTSLADQQHAIAAWAKAQGLAVDRFYVEAASSVREKFEFRMQMQALMAEVRKGDLVLCDKLDRWSRDAEFAYSSIRQILEAGANFYAVGDGIDPSTSDGDSKLGFRVLFAREEHKRIRERMVGTRRRLRDKGYYVEGQLPFGYRRREDVRSAERHVLAIEPNEAEAVLAIFQHCASGQSLTQICNALGLAKKRVHTCIRNRFYLGEIESSGGVWIAGKHPAIIDSSMFARANDALLGRRNQGANFRAGNFQTNDWVLRDVARCALCDGKMGAAWAGPTEARRYYYRCWRKCTTRFVRVDVAEGSVDAAVLERLVELRDELSRDVASPKKALTKDFAAEVAAYERKKKRVVDLYEDGAIDREEMRARIAKMLPPAPPPQPVAREMRRSMLADVALVERAWANATRIQKRQLINLLASAAKMAAEKETEMVWFEGSELTVNVVAPGTCSQGQRVDRRIAEILRGKK